MAAPAGVCISCGRGLQWTFIDDEMYVRCLLCLDLFGTEVAVRKYHEGREAVMPDGRPCRTIEEIVA